MSRPLNSFVIADAKACIGCRVCEVACAVAHAEKTPVQCHHCEDAPCAKCCPAGAIGRQNNKVIINEKTCIGCKSCMIACPFGAIELIVSPRTLENPELPSVVASKCDLCNNRSKGPACVQACPRQALTHVNLGEICPVDAIEGEQGKPQTINSDKCVMCGQCVQVCSAYASCFETYQDSPLHRLQERRMPEIVREPLFAAYYIGDIPQVKQALANQSLFTMVQCAPAVRVAIAEDFGMELGSLVPGKLAAALRRLGFKRIYDTNFAADLTIMEEGNELVKRITQGEALPMFTSCCPAWVKYVEDEYPELIKHLSSCKSPQQMAGTMFKTYGAALDSVAPEAVYSVAIMPCTCKKAEALRPEMQSSGFRDVDAVLTTRELAYLIKEAGIDFNSLPEESFDDPLGCYSGAGHIFGVTGGVMEAAIRTAYELITHKPLADINVTTVRGGQGIKKVTINAGPVQLKTVVVAGLKNAIPLLEELKNGKAASLSCYCLKTR
ncbi:MAG: hydrogenase, Fe-only [Anaerospora sp.]|nr:hydrogenase, Fe-only [Anaerospora sp.]